MGLHRQGFEDVVDVRPDEVQGDIIGAGGSGADRLGCGVLGGGLRHLRGKKAGDQGQRRRVEDERFGMSFNMSFSTS